jgi:DNA-binding MarR family transcriptional regulator
LPSRYSSEDLLTRETRLLYFIGKKSGYKGTISDISKELGYEDDSTVNRKINDLIHRDLIKEVRFKNNRGYDLTKEGYKKIRFLLLPRWTLLFLLCQSLVLVYSGVLWVLKILPINLQMMMIGIGFLSVITTLYLIQTFKESEERIWLKNTPSAELTDAPAESTD